MSSASVQRLMSFSVSFSALRLRAVIVFPMPRFLQRIGDLFGHVGLVMLGENSVGGKDAGFVERAFGDNALPFAEQIGQYALIGDRNFGLAVGDGETHRKIGAAHETAVLDEAAEPDARARPDVPLG